MLHPSAALKHATKKKKRLHILEKCYQGYTLAMMTVNNNLVFLHHIVDAIGGL